MEAVLELYREPYDPQEPVVCFDERPVQLVSETRTPLPTEPGKPERYDYALISCTSTSASCFEFN
jgi:hypothetical protein